MRPPFLDTSYTQTKSLQTNSSMFDPYPKQPNWNIYICVISQNMSYTKEHLHMNILCARLTTQYYWDIFEGCVSSDIHIK